MNIVIGLFIAVLLGAALLICRVGFKIIINSRAEIEGRSEADPFFLDAYIRQLWQYLGVCGPGGKPLRIAIYGAGSHTLWLFANVQSLPGPEVVALLDDGEYTARVAWNLVPIRPDSLKTNGVDAILISSDTAGDKIAERCQALFGDPIRVIHPYAGLPPGPYLKLL